MEANIHSDVEDGEEEEDSQLARRPATWSASGEEIKQEDRAVFRLDLLQALSKVVREQQGKAGEFHITGEGVVEQPLILIPLMMGQRRYLRDEEGKGENVICYSADGITGEGTPGGDCDTCPHSKFQKRVAPLCADVRAYICYAPQYQTLVVWNLSRSAVKVAKQINTYISVRGMRNFGLSVTSMLDGKGTKQYQLPVVKRIDLSDEMIESLQRFAPEDANYVPVDSDEDEGEPK